MNPKRADTRQKDFEDEVGSREETSTQYESLSHEELSDNTKK